MKKIFKKENDRELHKPKIINCKKEKIKINMNDYHTDNENKDKDKINEFISLLTEKISYNI